jgi:hypothetical protein
MRRKLDPNLAVTTLSPSEMTEKLKTALHDSSTTAADLRELLLRCCDANLGALSHRERVELRSSVPGKRYFAFQGPAGLTRAVNQDLFLDNTSSAEAFLDALLTDGAASMPTVEITRACYTLAMSFAAVNDIRKKDDKRTPGLFLEHLIGILLSIRLGIRPRKTIEVLSLDSPYALPTDFTFNLGKDKPKFHVPVKLSTRERVIQCWAHQKVLDGVYGTGRFMGLLVCLGETSAAASGVTEICLPDQWRIYQMFLARMHRIYYLDVPHRYLALGKGWPVLHIKPFGEFFSEVGQLADES